MVTIYYCIVFVLSTIAFFVVFAAVFALTALFDPERVVTHWMSRVWSRMIFAIHPGWRRRISGLENIDRSKAYVVVTNHQSMLDIPHMYALPLNFKWVSKQEVYRWPIFGWVLRMHRDIAISRMTAEGTRKFLNEGRMWLDKGVSVIIFPEGTRSRDGKIGRFKEGAFLLARVAGVAVLPVVADGTGRAFAEGKVSRCNTFTISVLSPIDAATVRATDAKTLAAQVQAVMEAEFERIKG